MLLPPKFDWKNTILSSIWKDWSKIELLINIASFIILQLLFSFQDDIKLWLPNPKKPPSDLDLDTSKFLLKQVGDHFCDLLVQEKNAVNEHLSEGEFFDFFMVSSFT